MDAQIERRNEVSSKYTFADRILGECLRARFLVCGEPPRDCRRAGYLQDCSISTTHGRAAADWRSLKPLASIAARSGGL